LCRSAEDLLRRGTVGRAHGVAAPLCGLRGHKEALAQELFAYVDRDADVFRHCHTMSTRRENRCCDGPRTRASSGPMRTSPTSCGWWSGSQKCRRARRSRSNGFSIWLSTDCVSAVAFFARIPSSPRLRRGFGDSPDTGSLAPNADAAHLAALPPTPRVRASGGPEARGTGGRHATNALVLRSPSRSFWSSFRSRSSRFCGP